MYQCVQEVWKADVVDQVQLKITPGQARQVRTLQHYSTQKLGEKKEETCIVNVLVLVL